MLWTREFLPFLALLGPWKMSCDLFCVRSCHTLATDWTPCVAYLVPPRLNGSYDRCFWGVGCAVVKSQTQAPGLGPRLLWSNLFILHPPLLYLSALLETDPNFTPFVYFEPSTKYSWAAQCRAAVLTLHTFSYYICSRFSTIDSALSTFVIQEWTTVWWILRFCEQKGTLCILQLDFC